MQVAGIDASTTRTGVSIMKDGELVYYTLIDLSDDRKDPIKRIQKMLVSICDVLDKYDLDAVYMEKAFKLSNTNVTIMLANLSGGIMLYCAKKGIAFNNPTPTMWRAKVGVEQSKKIKRDVLKAEAIAAVKKEYGIDVGDDVAESCLLARSAFDLPKIGITEDDLWN